MEYELGKKIESIIRDLEDAVGCEYSAETEATKEEIIEKTQKCVRNLKYLIGRDY